MHCSLRHRQLAVSLSLLAAHDSNEIWKVFDLDPRRTTLAELRGQYVRLARLVHPDKTGTPATAAAFHALQAAAATCTRDLAAASAALPAHEPGFAWWDEWDMEAAHSDSKGEAGPAGAAPAPEPVWEDMSLEEIRAEIKRRQAAMLDPPRDQAGGSVPLPLLRQALEEGKAALRRRLQQVEAYGARDREGGFVRGW
ncbi:hypothetical protein ACKKBG_A14170 [Auxenochlorella protothecoides x Auxenochlorella symbiontica]